MEQKGAIKWASGAISEGPKCISAELDCINFSEDPKQGKPTKAQSSSARYREQHSAQCAANVEQNPEHGRETLRGAPKSEDTTNKTKSEMS